jgi:hypothetical protein
LRGKKSLAKAWPIQTNKKNWEWCSKSLFTYFQEIIPAKKKSEKGGMG